MSVVEQGSFCTAYDRWLVIDFDDTLVKYAEPEEDDEENVLNDEWDYMYDVSRMRGYNVVIVTNQPRYAMVKHKLSMVREDLAVELGKSVKLLVATRYDLYRKPSSALFAEHIFPKMRPGDRVLFVGDSAGRDRSIGSSVTDRSDADYKFAANCEKFLETRGKKGLFAGFNTPEQFFLDKKEEVLPKLRWFNLPEMHDEDFLRTIDPTKKHLFLLIGPPCCGKATLAEHMRNIYNCVVFNKLTKQRNNDRIVLTDPELCHRSSRDAYARLLPNHVITCVVFDMGKEFYMRLNSYAVKAGTNRSGTGDKKRVMSNTYDQWYEEAQLPKVDDKTVVRAPFRTELFDSYDKFLFEEYFSRW